MTGIALNLATAAIVPLVFLLYFGLFRSVKTFRLGFLFLLPAAGAIAAVASAALAMVLRAGTTGLLGTAHPFLAEILTAFLWEGFLEETMKTIAVYVMIRNWSDVSESTDGIVAGIGIGLGFGFFESAIYLVDPWSVTAVRTITAVPLHASLTGIIGYGIAVRLLENRHAHTAVRLTVISFLHGVYNMLVRRIRYLFPAVFLLLAGVFFALHTVYRGAMLHDLETRRRHPRGPGRESLPAAGLPTAAAPTRRSRSKTPL
jgi:RsiW-degrading membrane proteinase PrsW (M82 family)